jgi:prophage regulatory protein
MSTDRLIPIYEVMTISGLGKSEIYARIARGVFPRQIHLGSASRWSEREVGEWVEAQKQQRDEQEPRRQAS